MSNKRGFASISACLFAIIVDALGFGLVYPVMTALFTSHVSPVLPITATLATRHFYLGLGFLLYPLAMFFGASFMGDLSDGWGRKKVLTICMIGIAISFLMMALGAEWGSLWLLFIGRTLSGLMAGSQPIAQAIIADISTPDNKARNMSFISVSYCIGVILGPIIGGVTSDHSLVSWFNYSTPFYIAMIMAIIAMFWLIFGFKDTSTPATDKSFSLLRPITIFIEAFHDKAVRLVSVIFLFMQIGFSLYFQFIVVQMRLFHHYSNWKLGAVNGMLGVGFALGLFVGTPIALKFMKVSRIATYAMLLTGIGAIAAGINHIALIQWFLAVFVALFNMMAFSSMLTLFSDSVDADRQGWVMGISGSVMAIAWAITGFGSNLLALIGTHWLIVIGGACLLVGSFILMARKEKNAVGC